MCCKALDLKAASLVTPRISAWREFRRTAPACVTNLVECAEAATGTISRLLLPPRVLHIDEGHIDEGHIDEGHIHVDEGHIDEGHIHVDEGHIDEG